MHTRTRRGLKTRVIEPTGHGTAALMQMRAIACVLYYAVEAMNETYREEMKINNDVFNARDSFGGNE